MVMSHRPGREGERPRGGHVPAYLAMEYLTEAYHRALAQWCGQVLTPREMAIVHVDADFRREVFVGPAQFDVQLAAIGRTSITLAITMRQSGGDAVAARLVLAHMSDGRVGASPFAADQRALLTAVVSSTSAARV
jgi:acyl-CoA thioesterase FadM